MAQTILLADDDQAVRSLVRRALTARAYRVLSAANGLEAVSAARTARPDLLLLDVDMPKMDGWETLGALRGREATRLIPVIMLTGRGALSDRVGGLERGADDYIAKPFALPELAARVESLLRRQGLALAANPLTRLPGAPSIESEAQRRLIEGKPFAFLYVDIDRFKAYNDAHGYLRGDQAILRTAGMLSGLLRSLGGPEDFLGHVGGDDFVLLVEPARADPIARGIAELFDRQSRALHEGAAPAARMSVSIAIVDSGTGAGLDRYADIADSAAQVKRFLKSRPEGGGSAFMRDRRSA